MRVRSPVLQTQSGQEELASLLSSCTLGEIIATARRIAGDAFTTPLLPWGLQDGRVVRLKAENLQPLGSFKIRSAASVLGNLSAETLSRGVSTASAGNFAQGLAFAAKRRGVPLVVHAPVSAARVKLAAIEALGAKIVVHEFDQWWSIMMTRDAGPNTGKFIHPVCERDVILGNATIGLEIARAWPEIDTVVVPFGGGGLICGIALAFRALRQPIRVIACESDAATPLASAFERGRPVEVARASSFIDGIGSTLVLAEMWPLLEELVDDVVVVPVAEAERAVRRLILDSHIVGEGAAGVAVAAADRCGKGHIAVVLSGGNIDPARLAQILAEDK